MSRLLSASVAGTGVGISAYVVVPEHVHLLVSETERNKLSTALRMLNQIVARKLNAWPERADVADKKKGGMAGSSSF